MKDAGDLYVMSKNAMLNPTNRTVQFSGRLLMNSVSTCEPAFLLTSLSSSASLTHPQTIYRSQVSAYLIADSTVWKQWGSRVKQHQSLGHSLLKVFGVFHLRGFNGYIFIWANKTMGRTVWGFLGLCSSHSLTQ